MFFHTGKHLPLVNGFTYILAWREAEGESFRSQALLTAAWSHYVCMAKGV
jgi:hypothetical protein